MTKLIVALTAVFLMAGCAETKQYWDDLEPAEKVVVGLIAGAVIVASSQGDTIKVGGNGCHKHGNPPSRWDCPEL